MFDEVGTAISIKINSALAALLPGVSQFSEEQVKAMEAGVEARKATRVTERTKEKKEKEAEKLEVKVAAKVAALRKKRMEGDFDTAGGFAMGDLRLEEFDDMLAARAAAENTIREPLVALQNEISILSGELKENTDIEKKATTVVENLDIMGDITETLKNPDDWNFDATTTGLESASNIVQSLDEYLKNQGLEGAKYKERLFGGTVPGMGNVGFMESILSDTGTGDEILVKSLLDLAEANDDITLSSEDLLAGFTQLRKDGIFKSDEKITKYIIDEMSGNFVTFEEAVRSLNNNFVGPSVPEEALGSARGKHNAIVGEAGTEVGITRGALKELASAGIPQYGNGQSSTQSSYNLGRDYVREDLYQAPGSVQAKADRAADIQAVGEAYRNEQRQFLDNQLRNQYNFLDKQEYLNNNFLDNQEDLNEKETYIRWRDQKEFFTKYPAIVDEAFGRPFREFGGDITKGVYNSIFSWYASWCKSRTSRC